MTATYSPFFASGLLATSYLATDALSGTGHQPGTPAVERPSMSRSASSSSSFTLMTPPSLSRTPSSSEVPRQRRRRSSFSTATSMTALASIKQSPARDATSAAVRYANNNPCSIAPPLLRSRSGTVSFSRMVEMTNTPCSRLIPETLVVTSEQSKRPKTPLRRSTVSSPSASSPRFKRERRASPNPPPDAPLPPVPSLPSN
ncbi:hypothetical protein HGRIS_004784 [Hohenbuehelia grisea]|uniref:Uncharacterized protein n=1 Tax=Hohenbuehelia grisea TaxID=104357 RepID=A0ABR3JD04_9AGAR